MTQKENIPDNNRLALDRTVLANDRTYQAWIRTGLALDVKTRLTWQMWIISIFLALLSLIALASVFSAIYLPA